MDPAGIWIAAALFEFFLLLFRSEWEKRQLRVENYEIKTKKLRRGARFVFLSDLHDASFGSSNARLLEKIEALSPDAVLIGGDLVTCGRKTPHAPKTSCALHLLEALSARFPVYYGEGNHEARMAARFPDAYRMYADHLTQLGVRFLRNAADVFDTEDRLETEEDDVNIYAVSLPKSFFSPRRPGFRGKEPMKAGLLSETLGEADRTQFNVLLLHTPLYLREAAAWGADLVLSGHFHGGTIRLPKLGGLMTPQYQFLVRECAGRFRHEETEMIVNRGLGTHSIRIRLNDLPEISCIDIVPETA